MRGRIFSIALSGIASACATTDRPDDRFVSDGVALDDGDDGSDDAAGTDAPADDRLDVGQAEDGCSAADLLFVIDNSGSMCDAQEDLAAVLPGLVDAMFDALPPSTDLHVGITTTSFSQGGSHQESACEAREGPGTIEAAYVVDSFVEGNGYQGRLFEHEGQRFFAANTGDPDARVPLQQWFSEAVVAVGCSGGAFEFPAAAAAYAAGPVNGEFNDGFIRDAGAALAIFVLSDEVDHSVEAIATYRDMVLQAKSACGGESCIVTAGMLDPGCIPGADPIVWQFLDAFGHEPVWGDIADFAAYDEVVGTALADAIVDTCAAIG